MHRESACLRRDSQPIEGEPGFGRKNLGDRRSDHAAALPGEKLLSQPAFERSNLPAYCSMGETELDSSFSVAAGSRSDLEDAQGIQWRKAAQAANP